VPLSQFDPFAHAYGPDLEVPGYLQLLNCHGSGVDVVLDRIQIALSTDRPQAWIDGIFADPNWRPHLVGAAALLLDERRVLNCSPMWEAIDRGSWVTPQLVATAYLTDPAFQDHVSRRLENRCEVSVPTGLHPLAQHTATGPANRVQRSAKLLSSLMSIGRRVPSLGPVVDRFSRDPDTRTLLEQDIDMSGQLAVAWCERVVTVFSARGCTLSLDLGVHAHTRNILLVD